MSRFRFGFPILALCLPSAFLLDAAPAGAHEIPEDVAIHTLVKAHGARLQILLRVPLESMRDLEFPLIDQRYLDIPRADASLRDAVTLWILDNLVVYEGQAPLPSLRIEAARVSIPSDRSFQTFDTALEHVLGPPLRPPIQLVWQQALMDVLLEAPIDSDRSPFSISTRFDRLGLRVRHLIRYWPTDGAVRSYETGGNVDRLPLDPNSYQTAGRFLRQGFAHIPDGVDHVLFLLCLVLPLRRRLGALIGAVTAFTVAHSITLAVSALGFAPTFLSFPALIEMLIAVSILYLAVENAVGLRSGGWVVAFGFGLIHGFGFSFALRDTLQFAGEHLVTSLLSFNLGVELGQLAILAVLVPALNVLFKLGANERVTTILIAVLVGHTAWHWMLDRHAVWQAYELRWSDLGAALLTGELRWLAAVLTVTAVASAALALRSRHAGFADRRLRWR